MSNYLFKSYIVIIHFQEVLFRICYCIHPSLIIKQNLYLVIKDKPELEEILGMLKNEYVLDGMNYIVYFLRTI